MPVNKATVQIANFAFGTASPTNPLAPVRCDDRGVGGQRTSAGKRAALTIARQTNGAGANPVVTGTVAVWGADVAQPNSGRPIGNSYATAQTPIQYPFLGDASVTTFQTNIPYAAFSNYNWILEMAAFKISGTFAVATTGVVTGTSGVASQTKLGDTVQFSNSTQILVTTITAYTDENTFTVSPAPGVAMAGGTVAINTSIDRVVKTHAGTIGSTNPELFNISSGATVDGVAMALITFAIAPPKNVGPASGTNYLTTGQPINPNCVYFVAPTQIKAAAAYGVMDYSTVRTYSHMWAVPLAVASELCATGIYLTPMNE